MGEVVAIIGSRPPSNATREWWQTAQRLVDVVISGLNPGDTVISGGAQGIDRLAIKAAQARGLATREYRAQWATYGRAAGMLRNAVMVDACHRVVAIWDGSSPGTAGAIHLAQRAGKYVMVWQLEPSPRTGPSQLSLWDEAEVP